MNSSRIRALGAAVSATVLALGMMAAPAQAGGKAGNKTVITVTNNCSSVVTIKYMNYFTGTQSSTGINPGRSTVKTATRGSTMSYVLAASLPTKTVSTKLTSASRTIRPCG